MVFFNFSWGPVMWVMLGEMFPNQMRGSALAVAGFAQWIANFAISVSFPWMAATLGLVVTYGFYAVSVLISFFLVQAWVKGDARPRTGRHGLTPVTKTPAAKPQRASLHRSYQ